MKDELLTPEEIQNIHEKWLRSDDQLLDSSPCVRALIDRTAKAQLEKVDKLRPDRETVKCICPILDNDPIDGMLQRPVVNLECSIHGEKARPDREKIKEAIEKWNRWNQYGGELFTMTNLLDQILVLKGGPY